MPVLLFLLPLPGGPLLAPVSIAVVMILWGTLAPRYALNPPSRDS